MERGDLSGRQTDVDRQMAAEARHIVDVARGRDVVLRLFGGLAVEEHCAGLVACLRPHGDVDMVGLGRQVVPVAEIFGESGFQERVHVRVATGFRQAQFVRQCIHAGVSGVPAHDVDHVDVFFDRFKLDHEIDLRSRLDQHPYAIPLTDLVATKLQMHAPEPRDVRDALMLFAVSRGPGAGAEEIELGGCGVARRGAHPQRPHPHCWQQRQPEARTTGPSHSGHRRMRSEVAGLG